MRFILIGLAILNLLFACKNEREEVVDFNSLSKPALKNQDIDTSTVKNLIGDEFYFDSLSTFSRQIIDSLGYDKNSIFKLDTLIYPDRFGALFAEKWYCKTDKDSLVYMRWDFKNNVMTKNTFYNWLDCFGANCKSIEIGANTRFSKRATCFFLVDKNMIYIESARKIEGEKWISVLSNIRANKKFDFFMLQQPKAKAVWNSIDENGVLRPITVPSN